jgi:hypothetical protein
MISILGHCLIPFVALLVAAVPLIPGFFDHRPAAKTGLIATALIVLFIAQSLTSIRDDASRTLAQQQLQDSLNAEHGALQSFSDAIGSIDKHVGASIASIERLSKKFAESGLTHAQIANANPQVIARSESATNEAAKISPASLSSDIKIIYFPKKVDGAKVIENLQRLGYRVSIGAPQLPDDATNAIWAGDKVPVADVKAIALTLMRAGVAFQSIKRFCEFRADHDRVVQVGTSGGSVDLSPTTTSDIKKLQSPLPRAVCNE